ncbi:MAG: hypothetical protein KDC44_14295, partial [Phaeodactylibacter sp.]|nr:hypothetical protein [Phaeodactylibacter sp.]
MNARRAIDLLTGLFLLFGNPLWAQGPSVWRITEEQGLPSQVLYSMVQDSIGYLWLATENGIAKFDGQQFTLVEDPNFPLGEVLSLRIDPLGRIWFMSLNGRLGYILDGQLYGFKPDEFTDDLEIIDFLWTAQSLWVNTKQSAGYHFFRYDLIGDSLAHQAAFVQFEENDQRRLFLLENGEIGSLFQNTIQRFSHEDQQFKRSISASFPEKIWRILGYSEDFLLLLSKSRLYSFKDSTLREVPLVEPLERNDFMFKKGNLLLITGKRGIYQYIQKEGLWEYKASLLPQISPNFIFQDRENNLWIGGNGSGLWMIPDLNIHLYQSSSKEENSIHVGCFEKQSNELLFVGYQNGELGQFELKADTLFYTPLPFHAQNGDFRAIRRQKEGRNFLIIENGRLNSLSPQFDKRWQITNNIKATALFQDTLWIANHLGIGQVAAGPSFV